MSRHTTTSVLTAIGVAGALALGGCASPASEQPPGTPAPLPTATADPSPEPTAEPAPGPVQPAGTPTPIASGLDAPWSIARLESGSTLVSERDTALIKEIGTDGSVREVGRIDGVAPRGEGGLLGIAPLDPGPWLYAYYTSETDNRAVRMPLEGSPGTYSLGAQENVITGIPKAGNHNGGRVAFGPDGALYVTAGDASDGDSAQDPGSLAGKILRLSPDGSVPGDNPTAGSPVYSLGHRNPQGIAWDADGQLWASEFGQNRWDELNVIVPGGNYGWPVVEGQGTADGFINPVYQWPTSDASPSGLAITRGTIFMAGLGGENLWVIYPGAPVSEDGEFTDGEITAVDYFRGEYGRIRDVTAGPDGSLWMLTNNTDGRGTPREGDDKLLQVELVPLKEG